MYDIAVVISFIISTLAIIVSLIIVYGVFRMRKQLAMARDMAAAMRRHPAGKYEGYERDRMTMTDDDDSWGYDVTD